MATGTITKNMQPFLPTSFDTSQIIACWRVIKNLYFNILILFITAGSYVLRKQFLKCILMLSFTAGYIMLLNISSPNQTYKVYAEVNYMPIAIFICVPFIWDVLPNIRFSKIAFYLGVLIIAQRLFDIAQTHQTYTQRLSFLQHSLNVNHPTKRCYYLHCSTAIAPKQFWCVQIVPLL